MNEKKLKCAAVNFKSVLGDTEKNLEKIKEICAKASKENVKIICFPEFALCGQDADQLGLKLFEVSDTIPGRMTKLLSEIAKSCGLYLIVGMSQKSQVPGRLFDTQVIFGPTGEIKATYQKIHIEQRELLYWKGSIGKEIKYFDVTSVLTGILMESDMKCLKTAERMKQQKVKLILVSGYGGDENRKKEVLNFAKKSGVKLLLANPKESFLVDTDGVIQASVSGEDEILVTEIGM